MILSSLSLGNTAVLIIVSSIVIFFLYKFIFKSKSSSKRNSIVIIGPSQSGKTTFFYHLLGNDQANTVVSMRVNQIDNFKSQYFSKEYDIIDIPGQGFFTQIILEKIEQAKCVLFFIDSNEKNSIVSASEYLYQILNSDKFNDEIPFVIVCNKQDESLPKGKKIIESELTNEVESLKVIKQKNNLEDTAQIGMLFHMKQKFSFGMFRNIKFIESDRNSKYNELIKYIVSELENEDGK